VSSVPVTMSCRTAAGRPWARYTRERGEQVLRVLALGRDELSLSLVDDREIRALNAAYRGRDRATDVLAFALTEDAAPDAPLTVASTGRRGRVLGDVVISIDTAAAQARASRIALAARLEALLVHGVLHLVGYDHERSPAEERRMRRKERAVRAALPVAPAGRRPGAVAASR
jgi:probable rRNA maturation factor